MTDLTDAPVFVFPCFLRSADDARHLELALAGLRAQTDQRWRAVLVDDASPDTGAVDVLTALAAGDPRFHVIRSAVNEGPGTCRNVGVRWAAQAGAPFVLFHDADDVSHPMRLEVTRQVFDTREDVDFVYSTFIPIDEHGRAVDPARLTPSVREVLDAHIEHPVHGLDAWVTIGTVTGYVSQTSTVAVRTPLAVAQPFPPIRGSEDTHTWYRMSAAGGSVAFLPGIAGLYRVPSAGGGSSDRDRLGAGLYYRTLIEMNCAGFDEAFTIATARGRVDAGQRSVLRSRLLRRIAVTVGKEGHDQLADELRAQAAELELSDA
ncbi:glycosyltransferase family 2 protein [Cellulomonas sp. P5_C5]